MSSPLYMRPPGSTDITKGHEIALALIEEFESDPDVFAARALLDPEYRHLAGKRAYENVVLLKLEEARLQGPEVEAGFCMILGDMLAVCSQGCVPHSDHIIQMANRGIIDLAPTEILPGSEAEEVQP